MARSPFGSLVPPRAPLASVSFMYAVVLKSGVGGTTTEHDVSNSQLQEKNIVGLA